jgi:RimJ/RimL family protein N-acetyltransferase
MQWHPRHEHVRGKSVPQRVQTDTVHAQILGRGADCPQCLLGLTAVPLSVVKTRPVSTKIEAALSRSTDWLALTHPKSATVAGERGTLRGERSVLALANETVLLRPWREADVPDIAMAFSDPVTQKFSWTLATAFTEDDARAHFTSLEPARLRGEGVQFALVEPKDEHDVLGSVSLYDISLEQGTAATGYWLAPQARGRGVVSTAVRLLARWGFTELGLARIELTCGPDNDASQRVAARCGFVREGVMRSHMPFKGGRRDTVIFSLLPDQLLQ